MAIRKRDGDQPFAAMLTYPFVLLSLHICTHPCNVFPSSLLAVVHGFEKASQIVTEGTNLFTTFSLNVKGETTLLGAVTGEITSRAGGTSRKLFYDHQICLDCKMLHRIRCAAALLEQDESEAQIRHSLAYTSV